MADALALTTLVAAVAGILADAGIVAQVVRGRKALVAQDNQSLGGGNRVCFVAGDAGGRAGGYLAPRDPSLANRIPAKRFLHALNQVVTVHCWAYDASAPEDESAQEDAALRLTGATLAAIYLVAHGTYVPRDASWNVDKIHRRYGAELVTSFDLLQPLPGIEAYGTSSTLVPRITDTLTPVGDPGEM